MPEHMFSSFPWPSQRKAWVSPLGSGLITAENYKDIVGSVFYYLELLKNGKPGTNKSFI